MRICTRPLIRAETWETYTNKKGGKSYKVKWLSRDFYDQIKKSPNWNYWNGNKYRKIEAIPCGKCIECNLNYSRRWATDLMLEKLYHEDNTCWFLTLTYNDEHLPINNHINNDTGEVTKAVSLNKKDLRDFWKRVRWFYRKNTKEKLVYLNVGEYGTGITSRPHYHAIVFGLPLDEIRLKKIGSNQNNDALFTHPDIEKLWGKGNIVVGRVTWESCAYVCRYTLKKINGLNKSWNEIQGRIPEFVSMSQGIAKQYYLDHWNDILATDSVPIKGAKAPRRFLEMLKEVNPEAAEEIKRRRIKEMEYQENAQKTDLNDEERRIQRNETKTRGFKDIRKEF